MMKKSRMLFMACLAAACLFIFAACGSGNTGTPNTNGIENNTNGTGGGNSLKDDVEDIGDDILNGVEDAGGAIKDGVEDLTGTNGAGNGNGTNGVGNGTGTNGAGNGTGTNGAGTGATGIGTNGAVGTGGN